MINQLFKSIVDAIYNRSYQPTWGDIMGTFQRMTLVWHCQNRDWTDSTLYCLFYVPHTELSNVINKKSTKTLNAQRIFFFGEVCSRSSDFSLFWLIQHIQPILSVFWLSSSVWFIFGQNQRNQPEICDIINRTKIVQIGFVNLKMLRICFRNNDMR